MYVFHNGVTLKDTIEEYRTVTYDSKLVFYAVVALHEERKNMCCVSGYICTGDESVQHDRGWTFNVAAKNV